MLWIVKKVAAKPLGRRLRQTPALLTHSPDGMSLPACQLHPRPGGVLVLVTSVAGIGNIECSGLGRRHEMERVAGDEGTARQFRLDFRHMARDALAAEAARRMMGLMPREGMAEQDKCDESRKQAV